MVKIIVESMKILSRSKSTPLDADDFAGLYNKHVEPVFNYFMFRLGNTVLAEDLTSDTFERAWRARRDYQPWRASFTTWLFTIARHLLIDDQRRSARHPWTALPSSQPDPNNPSPELELERSERQRHLRHLLQILPDDEQELIALKFGAGMPNKQMAKLLGKSETAIGSALYRIVKKLRLEWETGHEYGE